MAISNNDECDASKLLNLLVHANLRESGKLESAKRFRLASGLDDPSPMLDLSLLQLLIDYVKDVIADDHDDHHAERSDRSPDDDDPGLGTSFDDGGEFDYVGELSELFAGAAGPPRETDGCPRWVIAALFTIIVLGGYCLLCIFFATVISSLLGYMHLMPIIVICIVMFLWADDT